jgi:hexulose-6-phosphate isomerase
MIKGIQDWQGDRDEASLIAAAKAARRAGFEAFEPVLTSEGAASVAADEPTIRRLGEAVRGTGLEILSAACPLLRRWPLSATDAQPRQQARQLVIAALDRAAWLGAEVLVVEAGRLASVDKPHHQEVSYPDALNAVFESLRVLSFEAESRAVVLAIENPADAFLLSPVETRDLVDRIGSPWVQVCLHVGRVQRHGFPTDWIGTLGPRIVRVHVADLRAAAAGGNDTGLPGDGEVEWPAVVTALKRQGYRGALTCVGPGEPADLARWLDRVLTSL